MSISLYINFINELQKPPEDRNKDLILQYLFSLRYFSLTFNFKNKKNNKILDKLPEILTLRKTQKNEVLIQTGDKVNYLYLLLKGKATILFLNKKTFYMNEEEYFSFLFDLRLKKQFYLIKNIIKLNSVIFPFFEEDFDVFINNLSKQKTINFLYTKNKTLVEKAKEISKEIENENSESKILTFSPEEYINEFSVSKTIIEKSKKIREESRYRKIIIPEYKYFRKVDKGCTIGEKALESKDGCSKVSIICNDECDIGIINKDDYDSLLHIIFERIKKRFFSIISTFHIFSFLSCNLLEKKYNTFFIRKSYDRDHILFNEGKVCRFIYLILSGEFELSVNKNIVEINELIIKYKNTLHNIITKNNNINNKEINKYCNTNEEIKQNEDLLLNPKKNKIFFEKNYIKLGIFHSQEIMGLFDVFAYPENGKERQFENLISLLDCKCKNSNCEVYKFPLQMFNNIYNSEDKIVEVTKELEKQKITYMIERLQKYKKYFNSINVNKSEIFKNPNSIESYNNKGISSMNNLKNSNLKNNMHVKRKNFILNEFNKGNTLRKSFKQKNEGIKLKLNQSSKYILPKLNDNINKDIKSQTISVTQTTETLESNYKRRNNFFDIIKKAKNNDQKILASTLINSLVYNNLFYKCAFNTIEKNNPKHKSQAKMVVPNKVIRRLLKNEKCTQKEEKNIIKNKTNYSETKFNRGKFIFNMKKSGMWTQRNSRENGIYDALIFDEFTSSYNKMYKKFID